MDQDGRDMKKGILLSVLAVVLIAVIVCAIWYINEEGKMRAGSKDAFIPYNSAVVLTVNAGAELAPEIRQAFAADLEAFRRKLLVRITDTLRRQGLVKVHPYVVAAREEGKSDVAFLYVMDNKDVISRGEVTDFLNHTFAAGKEKVRKYDRHKIYTLKRGKEIAYFAVCGGIVLLSDSDLYIEDGLKQFDLKEAGVAAKPRYQNLNKYFSAGAGINVLLNTGAFTELMPLYIQVKKVFPHVDITRFFKWGALDGDFSEQGICLNGFMNYSGQDGSYIATLEKQQARETNIDRVLPSSLIALGLLNLSNPAAYFAALDNYRYMAGQKENVFRRKQQFVKMFGKGREKELRDLLQGEFAVVDLAYNEATCERDGLIVAGLKSGGLCRVVLEKMMKEYARFDNRSLENYWKEYNLDREKTFRYCLFPADDLAAVYWGYVFEGIRCRYVLVEDNYLIFASSEGAVRSFVRDYVHGDVIRDAEWYRHLKTRMAGKYNMAYFARTAEVLPFYASLAQGGWQQFLLRCQKELSVFPSWAWQWSNEGDMFYTSLFLSTAGIKDEVRPHVLWQTKLAGKVSMKPVPVTNHVTGEKELFVQDDRHTVYLINDVGRVLWKLPLEKPINSEVYQVDLFKNGKLQYLFSTSDKMYLIDRNGNAAGRFPVAFRGKCEQGISVFDYDNNRNYRIFVPCEDRKVYLYGLDGKQVKGWNPPKTDKPAVSKVQHFRVADKDYIVFADRYRFYILDRKGKERVRVSSVFDLKSHTDIYLTRKGGQPVLAFAGKGGRIYLVDFAGQTETFRVKGLSDQFEMNIADWDGNGVEDALFTDGDRLLITRLDGVSLFEKDMETGALGFPYVYRFSANDVRVGLTAPEQNRLFLLSADGSLSEGFPIAGDSPFSIVFLENDGFFLFAGTGNDTLLKYKVQH